MRKIHKDCSAAFTESGTQDGIVLQLHNALNDSFFITLDGAHGMLVAKVIEYNFVRF